MSKIKLNEVELRRLIKESVKQVLESKEKQILLEMAFSRKIYKEKVDNEIPQILTNWCLVRYCSKQYEDVLIECVEHLDEIIDVILSKDASHIASYVSNL